MDPATLATVALTILTPFAKDAGKELVKTVGEIAAGKAKDLFAWLKQRFAGDPVAAKDMSRFEAEPDKFQPSFESTIKEKAEQDPEFAAELKKRIDDFGSVITVFQDIKEGKKVIGVDADKLSGKVNVTQKMEKADDVTGVRIGERSGDRGNGSGGARKDREITVTGHLFDGTPVSRFKAGDKYRLRFRVGPPSAQNLASGNTTVKDVPSGGLNTHWVVTSANVEFVRESSTAKIQHIDHTWVAEFNLLIPESGSSTIAEVPIVGSVEPGRLLVTIYAVSNDDTRDLYRELSVNLGQIRVEQDETCKSPRHTLLRTTHEWTTPPEHIQVSIINGIANISTKRARLENYEFFEPFPATDTLISGAIQNVRDSLERLRETQESYLNNLNHADIEKRLSDQPRWQPYFEKAQGWSPLPDGSDSEHRTLFDEVQRSTEWRSLASDGYALFDRCFPAGTKLRVLLTKLLPGSRIDFHWSAQSGPGFVSHVPWALMYMEPVDVTGKSLADPEKFLGLRFRIGTRSWNVNNGSLALGSLDTVHSLHLMYWGNKQGDDVAVESQWQIGEYKKWNQSTLLPDPALPDLKNQIVVALDSPRPSPVSVLYFYCHCSVGDGAQPYLRFGSTSRREDTIGRNDLSQRSISDGPLLFANACTTAQSDPHMTSELEQSFFQRGVRAFIGTESKVPISLASKFAWLYFQFFYRKVDPDPMAAGEALTQARMFLWTQYKNVGGLFYSIANQYDLYLASNDEVLLLR